MTDTGSRILALLGLLEARRDWPGAELAERLGVSPRTLRRDVDRLRELGYPVEAARGVGGGYQLGTGSALPPLVLDDDEAVALVLGLHTAADSPVAGVAESSVRALAKTLGLMPERLRDAPTRCGGQRCRARGAPACPTSRPRSSTCSRTCVATRCGCRSRTPRGAAATERYVEPYRLVVLSRRWYLLAFDVDRDDWRNFRLDRMTDARATVGRFDPRPVPDDPVAFVRGSIERMPREHDVVVDVDAPAPVVEDAIGRWSTVEPRGVDGARVRMTADDLEWPVLALAQLDADFTVVEPAALRDRIARHRSPLRPSRHILRRPDVGGVGSTSGPTLRRARRERCASVTS